jgi:hypothetical protein
VELYLIKVNPTKSAESNPSSILKIQRTYYLSCMTTISLKVPDNLDTRLVEEARRRRTSKSAVIRECVEQMLLGPRKGESASCLDLAGDLAGCLSGPRDIATNPEYFEDFGQCAKLFVRPAIPGVLRGGRLPCGEGVKDKGLTPGKLRH